ncbi:seryl-tRNA ligase SerS [Gottschalkia acidurici 9a]|uniref:Serine--tRNA ligase n=1 Tax=Gottschalkia acidurici (strain ATCC 7906 / DSM 604 / BCRC 14475 / CIP 104303 / KCTC 5404 / NCIMB 10678 / 9a) TaxID=1128398 RepID=K0ATC0_GOTA9|nr:serine--tRNA ligase [Gottschalkia acidurici]AFS77113.1 seryl-tRNA ligase SerS [Gottschalkia acidurici 9a]
MLDIKRIRNNPEEVKSQLSKRGGEYNIDLIVELDESRRKLLVEVEEMKAKQNQVSKEIPKLKKEGKDASEVLKEMKELSDKVTQKDIEVKEIEAKLHDAILEIPNIPNADIVVGASDEDNVEIRKVGEPHNFDFEVKPHWDLGTDLDILDFERATKLTGARFTLFKGLGATLERALINFMLSTHTTKHGYTEVSPPFMVNRQSMIGTGQLPKFEEDMFKISGREFYLIPTAEVPVTNIHRDEILDEEKLPLYYTAYTPCFRQEAGSAGRDTRGIIRNHQFDKIELVKLVKPESSYEELEKLTDNAEQILKALNIPYRVVELCTGDIGFSSAKTYDIEVWMPSYGRYVEISSCSNFEDFQARRANLRYRSKETGKPEFVHTLNGSGLAVGRTLAALLENYQQEDGSIVIPEALRPFMGGLEKIEK